jgi:rhomboid family GlyGly-CTERM serine protease
MIHLCCITLCMIIAQMFADQLQYCRDLYLQQPWQLITAHLVHLNGMHLLLNVTVLWMIYGLFNPPNLIWFYSAGLVSSISIIIYIHYFLPDYYIYRGISGVLHGWYAGLSILVILQPSLRMDRMIASLILGVLMLKMMGEFMGVVSPTHQMMQIEVLYHAHLVGVFSVICFTFLWWGSSKYAQLVHKTTL